MQTSVGKWGASCAIRLPKMAVETLGLHAGQEVSIHIENDTLVLRKETPRYQLEDLVAEMDGCEQMPLELGDDSQGDEWQ